MWASKVLAMPRWIPPIGLVTSRGREGETERNEGEKAAAEEDPSEKV